MMTLFRSFKKQLQVSFPVSFLFYFFEEPWTIFMATTVAALRNFKDNGYEREREGSNKAEPREVIGIASHAT